MKFQVAKNYPSSLSNFLSLNETSLDLSDSVSEMGQQDFVETFPYYDKALTLTIVLVIKRRRYYDYLSLYLDDYDELFSNSSPLSLELITMNLDTIQKLALI